MAAKKAAISISLIADAAKAKAGFAEAEKAAGGFGTQMGNLGKTVAATFATKAITDFARSSITAASDLGESINAVQVTFGDAADEILAFGETASKVVGMSAEEYNSFAVQFAGFTKQIAGDNGDIAGVTEELTTRIADFASVMNLDIPQAAQVFQSTLAGQTEPIRAFGIDMSAASVAAFAVQEGIAASATEMTQSEKIQATYLKLMQDTEKVAGDFGNTSDSLANSQRILKADFQNMQAEIGQALLPVMEQLVGFAKLAIDAFNAMPEPLQEIVALTAIIGGGMRTASRALQGFGLAAKTANLATGALGGAMLVFSLHAQNSAKRAQEFEEALDGLSSATDENLKAQFAATFQAALFAEEFGSAEEFVGKLAETSIGTTERLRDLGIIQEGLGLTTEEVNGIIDDQIEGFRQAEADAQATENAIDGLTQAEIDAAKAQEEMNEALKEQEDALQRVLDATLAQFNAALQYESQQWRTKDAIDAYTTAQLEAAFGNLSKEESDRLVAEASNDAASAALTQAAAAAKLAEDQALARGETLTAAEAAAIQVEELSKLAQSLAPGDPLRQRLEQYIQELNNIPPEKNTNVNIFETTFRTVIEQVQQARETGQVDLGLSPGVTGALPPSLLRRARGGPVSPSLGPYIVGEEGPELFLPGQSGMIMPNTALIDAMARKVTTPGMGGAPTVVVNVSGSVTSERDLVESIRKGLVESQRSGNKVVV